MAEATEVLTPDSPEAAAAAFGEGGDVTIIGGGTIMVPLVTHGVVQPNKALILADAGLEGVDQSGTTVTIGAMTSVSALSELDAPLGPCAANLGDSEVRDQATVGGNLCAVAPPEHPTGDLQGAFVALGASVRSTGAGGERIEPVADFLADRDNRLVLDVTYEQPQAGAFESLDRPHTHHPTPLAVSGARLADGSIQLAATGAAPTAVRLPSAEAEASDPDAAGTAALGDVRLVDDAVSSAWYRERILPVLVRRVLEQLG
ncbi:MAG: FAD binding domain-containing protein [Acidimicrobiia bacterium]|nr:FAD binding domain-containing protein [Acidimicrobiia bacterium]